MTKVEFNKIITMASNTIKTRRRGSNYTCCALASAVHDVLGGWYTPTSALRREYEKIMGPYENSHGAWLGGTEASRIPLRLVFLQLFKQHVITNNLHEGL